MKVKSIVFFIIWAVFIGVMSAEDVSAVAKKQASPTVSTTYSLRRDKKALNVYFKNLNIAKSVSYTLSYTSNGEPRGVVGTIDAKKKYSLSRQFLFGTCSNKVCRYDPNIKNMVLEVVTVYKNGKSASKKYKIRV